MIISVRIVLPFALQVGSAFPGEVEEFDVVPASPANRNKKPENIVHIVQMKCRRTVCKRERLLVCLSAHTKKPKIPVQWKRQTMRVANATCQ
jgi:hypothetical protein